MHRLMFAIMALALLTACAPDPRKEADARETVLLAEQTVLDKESERAIVERQDKVQAQIDAYDLEVRQSTIETAKARANAFVFYVGMSLTVAVSVMVIGAGWSLKQTVDGFGKAAVMAAQTRASLIHMDRGTHSFPALVSSIEGSQFLTMLATGENFRLIEPTAANPQMVAGMYQVSVAGTLADAAAKGKADPYGIASIQPTVIQPLDVVTAEEAK